MKKISILKDNVIGVEYSLVLANAKKTSDTLKDIYSSIGIDYNDFNSDYGDDDKIYYNKTKTDSVNTPPSEIYEYQNFFLLRKEDGNLILLDGFRRLLWYNAPDQDILVRIYDKEQMTDKEVLQILIHLNHTKFFGGIGDYFDRGFSLALNSIFGLKILKYSKVFNAYLSKNSLIRKYSFESEISGEDKNQEILNRILSDKFIEDMKFVQGLLDNDIMLNSNFGVLLWTVRQENPDFVFSSKLFVEKHKENKYIKENYSKYLKAGDGNSAESTKVINRMIELYTAVFNEMLGKEIEKSYLELKDEAKFLVSGLKKNKSLYKITDTKSAYKVENEILDLLKKNNNFSPKISLVVHPYDDSTAFSARKSKDTLPSGLYEDFYLESIKMFRKTLGGITYNFLFVNKDRTVKIRSTHVSHGHFSFSDNYDGVERILSEKDNYFNKEFRNQDADVFINTVEVTDKKVEFIDKTKQ